MTVHILKMAVGVEDVPHLARIQEQRRQAARERGEPPVARHVTRMTPRRTEDVLAGGSIYWVIRGFVQVRQRIIDLEATTGSDGIARCAICLHEELVRTSPRPNRAFQGWRYLDPKDAPADVGSGPIDGDELPPELAMELRALGLL